MIPTKRPPIVTVLGHVDHGKTSLLDYIRKTSVTKKEAGGITQSIGASVVKAKDGSTITFIDTPGHAAFSSMRSRGAKLSDIAILIVAGNDGVMPQTKEALEAIRNADIPYIVAATKKDLQTFSLETVTGQLEKLGVLFEGRGGDVPLIPVSSVSGDGIDHLLEMIALVSELHEVKGDPEADLEAVIIETTKDQRGPAASVVVRNGTLKVSDEIATDTTSAKVRGLFDWQGAQVQQIAPGEPGYVIGFEQVPSVGSRVWHNVEGKQALVEQNQRNLMPEEVEGKHTIIIKAKNTGALEAILASIPKELFVVSQGVGDITENDIFLAKAAKAGIYAFEVKAKGGVGKLASTEGVVIEEFSIVYELFQRLEELAKKGKIEVVGKAQIIASFPFENKLVAGSRVQSGLIGKVGTFILQRNEKDLGNIKILSIRKGKNEVPSVRQGEECGIFFAPQLDFKIGDVILSVRTT
jgi:translation initiation factor IF-2